MTFVLELAASSASNQADFVAAGMCEVAKALVLAHYGRMSRHAFEQRWLGGAY